MPAQLIVRAAEGGARVLRLETGRYTLGRSSTNQFSYPEDGELSRQHLALELMPEGWWTVSDLGSRNGTLVNGVRIAKPTALKPRDRITAGRLQLEFSDEAATRDDDVVFVEKPQQDQRSATVVISLEKVLDSGTLASASHAQVLVQAGRELVDRRPLEDLFPLILDLAAGAVGSSRGVLMIEENSRLAIRAAKGSSFEISTTVRDRVMNHKESLLIQDVELDENLRLQASIVAQSIRSVLAVPLQAKKRVIGLLYLDSTNTIRPFTREDLNLLTVLANIAAIRIENARLTEVEEHERLLARELAQAAEIQQSLLPKSVPALPGLEVAAFSAPCRSVGGDHYDFYERAGGKLTLMVGDVSGKGMPAALLMSSLQARIQVLIEEEIDLALLVTRLNRIISSNCPGNRFITFFICEVDPVSGNVTFVNAGHNPPLLIRGGGDVERLSGGGIILGILGRAAYTQHTCKMNDGDILVIFTDGVTEAQKPGNEEEFGEDRMVEAIQSVRGGTVAAMIEHVKQSVAAFAGSVTATDDFTLVLARKAASQ